MTTETEQKLVKIISSKILTPVIYMLENNNVLDFICFLDRNITTKEIYDAEKAIMEFTGMKAEIIDIREFSETERMDVIQNSKLIHSEHPMVEFIFAQSMAEDYRASMNERKSILDRVKETGTIYLQ